jgi:RNA ligase (TIGR02306 family)
MSDISILAVKIDAIYPHINADRLEIIKIGAYQTCETRGKYQVGDVVAHFPPDILIPSKVAIQLGVENYLKEAVYPGDVEKSKCRVGAIRLRGIASFGFTLKVDVVPGTDLTERFHGVKYEPPEPEWFRVGAHVKSDPRFHIYTDIQNYRNSKFKNAVPLGTPVRLTEKIYGTNSRVGLIDNEFMCGSHRCTMQATDKLGHESIYWKPLTPNMKDMLRCISAGDKNVIAFGEIYGSKVQFMDYGKFGVDGYALFDISVDGTYLNWDQIVYYATRFCVPLVPILYSGPFDYEVVEQLVDGDTIIGDKIRMRSSFKGREGVVITPLIETFSPILGGRMILKAISCDYLECRKSDSH